MQGNPLGIFGGIIKNDFLPLLKMNPDQIPNVADVQSFVDYDYQQTHVNTYRMNQQTGVCPVSTLHIWRAGRMQDGSVAKLPWKVNIQEFYARQKPGALTAFDPNTVTDKKEVWIQVSDDDMFRCAYKVEHFVSLWETAIGSAYVQYADAERERQKQQYSSQYEEIPM